MLRVFHVSLQPPGLHSSLRRLTVLHRPLLQRSQPVQQTSSTPKLTLPISHQPHLNSIRTTHLYNTTTSHTTTKQPPLFACLSACLLACLPVCLSAGLPAYCLPAYLPVCLSACPPACLPAYCLPDYLPVCLSASPPACQPAYLPFCLCVFLPACLLARLSACSLARLPPAASYSTTLQPRTKSGQPQVLLLLIDYICNWTRAEISFNGSQTPYSGYARQMSGSQ